MSALQLGFSTLHPADAPGVLEVRATLRNTGSEPAQADEVTTSAAELGLDLAAFPAATTRVFLNGYQSWSISGWVSARERVRPYWPRFLRTMHDDLTEPSPGRPGRFVSHLVVCLAAEDGPTLCLGFLGTAGQLGRFRLNFSGSAPPRVEIVWPLDGRVLGPGEELELDTVRIEWGGPGWAPPASPRSAGGGGSVTAPRSPSWLTRRSSELALPTSCLRAISGVPSPPPPADLASPGPAHGQSLLSRWAAACGAAMQARTPAGPWTGWCSWYEHFRSVTQDKVLAALRGLEAKGLPGRYVVVDDGWQAAVGDWDRVSPAFDLGMKALADAVRGAGRVPGLWWAPLLVEARSRLAAERPDWLLRNAGGRPVSAGRNPLWDPWRDLRALDPSHPEVEAWLARQAARMAREWGFGLLKLDFLYAASLPGVRQDPASTRATALHRALAAVRRGAGDDTVLLGCGCPLGPAVGLVDLMRVGPDVGPLWGDWKFARLFGLRHGVGTAASLAVSEARRGMHGRLWINDPDCLIARARGNRLSAAQVRAFARHVQELDGVRFLGDDPGSLEGDRLELARGVLGA